MAGEILRSCPLKKQNYVHNKVSEGIAGEDRTFPQNRNLLDESFRQIEDVRARVQVEKAA
jgi:hypothetical protein